MEHQRKYLVFYPPSRSVLVIEDVGPTTPGNPAVAGRPLFTRYEAWQQARSQILPVVLVSRARRQSSYGRVFDPQVFERTVFETCSSTSNGSQEFEKWVLKFREDPSSYVKNPSGPQTAALATYKALLNAARAEVARLVAATGL